MKTNRRAAAALIAVALSTFSAPAVARATVVSDVLPGRALVRFDEGTPAAARDRAHKAAGARVRRHLDTIGYDEVSFSSGALDAVLGSYRADERVRVAEPVYTGRVALSPDDACHVTPCSGAPEQWPLRVTNTALGWDAFPGRTFTAAEMLNLSRVTIAVLDTKIDQTHPDWINAGGTTDARAGGQLDLANARDWVPLNRQSGSAAYHGTFVAGLAGAAAGNGRDVAGVGYAARIMPLTVVDGGGTTDSASLADAIVFAWQRGARVINLSLGINGNSTAVRDAIRLVSRGDASAPASLVVAAAGNNTGSAAFYPGSYPEVMSVSGTTANDERASCSNFNTNVSVSAPADRLVGLTMMPGGRTQAPCGTSAAAPQVSGLAAMLFMQDPSRTPAQVRALIERSADDLGASGRDDHFGWGRINVDRALRTAGPATTTARATAVGGSGGSSTITATAAGAPGVKRAQVAFDRPDAAWVEMQAADGAFGGATEAVRATITVPSGLAPGAHYVTVRAFDGSAWGGATVGVLMVDARAPTMTGVTVSNVVRAANQPMTLTFAATDDVASTINYGVEVRSTATGAIVWRKVAFNVAAGAQRITWMPGLDLPAGHYKVKLGVGDPSGNASTTEAGTIIT